MHRVSCWPVNMHTTTNLFSRFSEKLAKFVCGSSAAADEQSTGVDSPLLFPSVRVSKETLEPRTEDKEMVLPCVTFRSQLGFCVFSLADDRLYDDVRLPLVLGRRLLPSPYGGLVFSTDLFGRYPSSLVNPFTGESTPLPDLPIPFSDMEPMPCGPNEPRKGCKEATDDRFAWDWSPHGVLIARGDTVFFCKEGGDSWTPICRSMSNSSMTINYRDGFFFVLEECTLFTTVIDAETLEKFAVISPPPGNDITVAYLVASTDDVLLLVCRDKDEDCMLFSQVYRAKHKKRRPKWSAATDIGDRALFVDRIHGFSVSAGEHVGALKNCVYSILAETVEDPRGRRFVEYGVGVFNLKKLTERQRLRCELRRHRLERLWGEPYWIIRKDDHLGVQSKLI